MTIIEKWWGELKDNTKGWIFVISGLEILILFLTLVATWWIFIIANLIMLALGLIVYGCDRYLL